MSDQGLLRRVLIGLLILKIECAQAGPRTRRGDC
jgi:hypothetical protein